MFGSAGFSTSEVPVSVALQYLVPGITYHYRLVATSFDGTSYGQDETFTTPGIANTVVQPPSAPLIATPVVQFPSIKGAITNPSLASTPTSTRKLADALKACKRKSKKQRAACEKQAKKRLRKT